MNEWRVFTGSGEPHDAMRRFEKDSPPPPWRRFHGRAPGRGKLSVDAELRKRFEVAKFQASEKEIEVVNAAIHLRRPLLVTGRPGTGKTTLAYAVAHELKLGSVLRWSVTSRSVLQDSLYRYDAIARLQEVHRRTERGIQDDPDIGEFIRLGPLGTALLPSEYPRVLLIDEIDKSDIDLPNDLLHVLEEGRYEVPELVRISGEYPTAGVMPADSDERVAIQKGRISCQAFPIIILTSNGEREFPGPFLRRCVRLNIPEHDKRKLAGIVNSYFVDDSGLTQAGRDELIDKFLNRRSQGELSTDQLLNAIYLARHGFDMGDIQAGRESLSETIWKHLSGGA